MKIEQSDGFNFWKVVLIVVLLSICGGCLAVFGSTGSFGFHPLDPEAEARADVIEAIGVQSTRQALDQAQAIHEQQLRQDQENWDRKMQAAARWETVKEFGRNFTKGLFLVAGVGLAGGVLALMMFVFDQVVKIRKTPKVTVKNIGLAMLTVSTSSGIELGVDLITGKTFNLADYQADNLMRAEALVELIQPGKPVEVLTGQLLREGQAVEVIQAAPIRVLNNAESELVTIDN
jgi:hypothetical protein